MNKGDNMKAKIEETLALFPEVKWDRWAGDLSSDNGIGIFGWMARKGGRSDFVFLRIDNDGPWLVATSSAEHSAEFTKRVGFTNHTDCKRVKDHFNIPYAATL
jgi:hypothetical protein